jgi:hypothetical protein
MVRKREERFHPDKELSLGLLTDEEAQTIALNQYIAGGLITFSEYLPELGEESRALYRHVIPSVNTSSVPLDIFDQHCPSLLRTEIAPRCSDLEPWVTVAWINWSDTHQRKQLILSEKILQSLGGNRFLVFEFFSQEILGIYQRGQQIDLGELSPHGSCLLRIVPWDGSVPVLAGTDLHFSGGGVEVISWDTLNNGIKGEIDTRWRYPVKVHVAFPAENKVGYTDKSIVVQPGQAAFYMAFPAAGHPE